MHKVVPELVQPRIAFQVPWFPVNCPLVTENVPPRIPSAVAVPLNEASPSWPPMIAPMSTWFSLTTPLRLADIDWGQDGGPEVALTEISPLNWLLAWVTFAVPRKAQMDCIWITQGPDTSITFA